MDKIFNDFENEIVTRVYYELALGQQLSSKKFISGECLQDHWSSGFLLQYTHDTGPTVTAISKSEVL